MDTSGQVNWERFHSLLDRLIASGTIVFVDWDFSHLV